MCLGAKNASILPYAETCTHKLNTHLVLVSCRGRTVCKKLWVLLTPVGVSLIAERWSKYC